jgi:hypothetical protein
MKEKKKTSKMIGFNKKSVMLLNNPAADTSGVLLNDSYLSDRELLTGASD